MAIKICDLLKNGGGINRIKADPVVLGSVTLGPNQTKAITLSDSILNYTYLLGQLYQGASMLSTVYISISSLAGGSQYRLNYHDGAYSYMGVFSYVNNTKINAQGIWTPTSVSLGARILGIKEYTVAQ